MTLSDVKINHQSACAQMQLYGGAVEPKCRSSCVKSFDTVWKLPPLKFSEVTVFYWLVRHLMTPAPKCCYCLWKKRRRCKRASRHKTCQAALSEAGYSSSSVSFSFALHTQPLILLYDVCTVRWICWWTLDQMLIFNLSSTSLPCLRTSVGFMARELRMN